MNTPFKMLLLAASASLTACGGGSDPASTKPPVIQDPPVVVQPPVVQPPVVQPPVVQPPVVQPPVVGEPPVIDNATVRGTLVQSPPALTQTLTQAGVSAAAARFGAYGAQLMAAAGTPQCGIDIHQVEYATVGAVGEPTRASAAMMVPTGSAAACAGKRPLVVFAHGTSSTQDIAMGTLDPSAPYANNSIAMAAYYAAQGYVVLAPNYAGYNSSTLSYHPHQIADQMAKDIIDAVAAARKALPNLKTPVADNGQLFLTGYSEGGYATMATHRAMQAEGITVTASSPHSGTYAQAAMFEALMSRPNLLNDGGFSSAEGILDITIQFTAWQKAYGNLYASPSELYNAPWAQTMETIGPVKSSEYANLAARVPTFIMSRDMPNFAALSPGEQAGYGTPETSLLKTSYLTRLLADMKAIPCPATAAGDPLACATTHPVRNAWFKNDLRTWTPKTPILMCGAQGDRKVPWVNAQLTAAYFQAHGVAPGIVTVLDVSSPAVAGDPHAGAKAAFLGARKIVQAGGGDPDTGVHGFTTITGCSLAARDFFATFR